jgi:aryl-alcohol dehydrogenase-like predicted oxidoreductase
MKALAIAEQNGYAPVCCIQPMYNLLKRQCESELLPMAESENLSVLPYGPVAGGYLTGKYLVSKTMDGRFADSEMYQDRYSHDSNSKITNEFIGLAKELDVEPTSLAIAWVASNPLVTAPIVGARSVEQLDTALASLEIKMSNELRQAITNFSLPPASATDRTEEQ